jgi:hypothetical protein
MDSIRGRINAKTAAAAAATVAVRAQNHPPRQSNMPAPPSSTVYSSMSEYQTTNANSNPGKVEPRPGEYVSAPQHGMATPPSATYGATPNQSGGQYPYSEPPVNGTQAFQNTYPQPLYAMPENPQLQTSVGVHTGQPPQATSSTDVYDLQDAMYFPAQSQQQTSPINEWLRWSQPTLGAFSPGVPQEYSSANALVALGGRNVNAQDSLQNALPLTESSVGQAGAWPTNLFNLGKQNGNGGV